MMEEVAFFYKANPDSDVQLPERATGGSAGYDFYAPTSVTPEERKQYSTLA